MKAFISYNSQSVTFRQAYCCSLSLNHIIR